MRILRAAPCEQALALGIGLLAAAHLVAAGWMLLAPESFVHAIGPASGADGHDVRPAAALLAAQGVGLTAALLRPALRTGVLTTAIATLALLTTDRWIDITGGRVAAGAGSLDAGLLTLGLALALALAIASRRCSREPAAASTQRLQGTVRSTARG